jgi:hypothetical protein
VYPTGQAAEAKGRDFSACGDAILEAPGLITGFGDFAVMHETIEQRGGHFGVAEDARPFTEGEIQNKYLHNLVEQDHRAVKRVTRSTLRVS